MKVKHIQKYHDEHILRKCKGKQRTIGMAAFLIGKNIEKAEKMNDSFKVLRKKIIYITQN